MGSTAQREPRRKKRKIKQDIIEIADLDIETEVPPVIDINDEVISETDSDEDIDDSDRDEDYILPPSKKGGRTIHTNNDSESSDSDSEYKGARNIQKKRRLYFTETSGMKKKYGVQKNSDVQENESADTSNKSGGVFGFDDESPSTTPVELSMPSTMQVQKQNAEEVDPESESDYDSDEADVTLIERFVDIPDLYVRKLAYSETTSAGKKKKSPRVYNSYQYCAFCKSKVSNFAQHIRRRHKAIDTVSNAINPDLDKKEQIRRLTLLRLEHNHIYNMQSLARNKGEIFVERRSGRMFIKDYGPCPICRSWVGKAVLWRHQNTCKGKPPSQLSAAALITQSDTLAKRIIPSASTKLTQEVFSKLRHEVGLLARQDGLIVALGNQWLEKNVANLLKRGKYTSQVMRLNTTNLINMRKVKPLESNCMWDYLTPENFDVVVQGTLMTAAASMDDDDDLKKPSNAIKLGFDIKRMLNIKAALSVLDKNNEARKDADDFRLVMNTFWATKITKLARVILLDRQFNKEIYLPHPSDLAKLNEFLAKKLCDLDLAVKTPQNFKLVAEVVAAKVSMYNRRRPGEMENMR